VSAQRTAWVSNGKPASGHMDLVITVEPNGDPAATIRKPGFLYKLMQGFPNGAMWLTTDRYLAYFCGERDISGIDPRMANVFTVTTVLISIPIAEMCFVYIATLYGASIQLTTAMLFALCFIVEFLIGGVTGIFLGASGTDIYFHDTYFVLAHFHYTFVPIAIIGTFAAVTFWFPKMFGRMMDDRLGKIHFWGTIIPFNMIFIPLFVLGAAGDHRRIRSYENFPELARPELQNLRVLATISMLLMLSFQLVFFYNFIKSLMAGPKAGRNPWQANTLEWTAASPPPHGNFATLPTVYRGPYEYSVPGRDKDYWPQDAPS
jgi:cytochrome c oxidase subunit 1